MRTITARRASFSATRVSRTNCGPMTDAGDFTEDAFLGGQLRLRQPKSGHRAAHDAVLLAAATAVRSGDRVVDFVAGVAAAGRAVASLAILPVHADAKTPAMRVLIRAIKGGRAPTQLYPALVLNDESALPNKQVQEILAGKGVLPLAVP